MQGNTFARLLERVASVPHRSITSLPYGEWFSLYVQALKDARREERMPHDKAELYVEQHALDVALLSSVVSQKWSDVVLPSASSSTTGIAWCRESTEAEWLHPSSAMHRRELVTTSFLVEPLLAGRAIASWTRAVRQGNASFTVVEKGATDDGGAPAPKLMIMIPFTTLFQLRCEAYLRPQSPSLCVGGNKTLQPPLLLQERSARLSTLQSVRHLMELQSGSQRTSRVQFLVWNPVSEFDAIMQISRVRAGLPETLRNLFSLSHVCEREAVRIAYLAHYLNFSTKGAPLTLLAPQLQFAKLQQLGITNFHDRSQLTLAVEERHRVCGDSKGGSLHQQAVNRCGKLVRRMSTREDNLRHILIP
ncbi:hypothetical protein TraAM80_05154 [Trypanosoma rangeli]|uniref:Uncharacterized protein n=1 Tax=Trypanosoma rangeli TaxID=5698 RepID=A0A3R7LW25_TRYRA|nr:uncharacterized protein TraAM80_05154 [Trypanosoma rangeli]RNF04439.1 hypothetical protein TraAM80_05154 [Trypanosoma rangeli]|eukprot:RNF04439.1 hypothetical protein TraAM80_05154 [Trypanosoma rangeli]